MVGTQRESLWMIFEVFILFQVEKHISELTTSLARLSCVFALFLNKIAFALFYTAYMWNVSYLNF